LSAKLSAIDKANGYSRNIGSRVHDQLVVAETTATPFVGIYDQEEQIPPGGDLNNRYRRVLTLGITFCDSYSGASPSEQTRVFLAEVQKAIGKEFQLVVPRQNAGGATGTITVRMREMGSYLNHSGALKGRIYGQVDYQATYETSIDDPTQH